MLAQCFLKEFLILFSKRKKTKWEISFGREKLTCLYTSTTCFLVGRANRSDLDLGRVLGLRLSCGVPPAAPAASSSSPASDAGCSASFGVVFVLAMSSFDTEKRRKCNYIYCSVNFSKHLLY